MLISRFTSGFWFQIAHQIFAWPHHATRWVLATERVGALPSAGCGRHLGWYLPHWQGSSGLQPSQDIQVRFRPTPVTSCVKHQFNLYPCPGSTKKRRTFWHSSHGWRSNERRRPRPFSARPLSPPLSWTDTWRASVATSCTQLSSQPFTGEKCSERFLVYSLIVRVTGLLLVQDLGGKAKLRAQSEQDWKSNRSVCQCRVLASGWLLQSPCLAV